MQLKALLNRVHPVKGFVYQKIQMNEDGDRANGCRIEATGGDEVAYQKGHRYLTLVYQIDEGCRRLLHVSEGRSSKSLLGFFRMFCRERDDLDLLRLLGHVACVPEGAEGPDAVDVHIPHLGGEVPRCLVPRCDA